MRLGLGLGVDSITSQKIGAGFTGLLDTVPDAFVAYSLDRISSAYTGGSVRVMRSSDTTEQDVTHNADGTINETDLQAFVNAEHTIADEDFSTNPADNGWVYSTGATWSADVLPFVNSSSSSAAYKNFGLFDRVGLKIRVSFTISNYSGSGTIRFIKHGGASFVETGNQGGTARSANGTYTEELTFSGSTVGNVNWGLWTANNFTGNIDDFEVVQITADGYITKIYDQSGNERTLGQSDNAKQFRIVIGNDVQKDNGKVIIVGDALNDHYGLVDSDGNPVTELTLANPISIFFAAEHDPTQSNNYILSGNSGSSNRVMIQDASAQEFIRLTKNTASKTIFNNGTDIVGEMRVWSYRSAISGTDFARMDKADWGNVSSSSEQLRFLRLGNSASNSNLYKWRELIIYSGTTNGDQTDNVETIENDIYTRTGRS